MARVFYSPELKAQVVKEAIETGNETLVAKKHNIPHKTVNNWILKLSNKKVIDKSKSFKHIEKENKNLKLENQILKDLLKKQCKFGATNKHCL